MREAGSENITTYFWIQDSTTGIRKTGLVFNSPGASCYYIRERGLPVQIALQTQTPDGSHTDGGFCEVDATNMPGLYRLDIPDALVASGSQKAWIVLQFTDAHVQPREMQIVGFDVDSNQRDFYAGNGAHAITLYVKDADSNPISNATVKMQVEGGYAIKETAADGSVSFNVDAGTYTAYVRTTQSYTPSSSYSVVVNASGTVTSPSGGVLQVTAQSLPTPTNPDGVLLYGYIDEPAGLGALADGVVTVYVYDISKGKYSAAWETSFIALGEGGTGAVTDSNGKWQLEVPAGCTLTLMFHESTNNQREYWRVTVPVASGTHNFWSLNPEETVLL